MASLDRISRSRRRRSDTSRSSTSAPVTTLPSMSGTHRSSTITSLVPSISTVTGDAVANAVLTARPSTPSSSSVMPSVFELIPMRCSALSALGDVYSTRPVSSSSSTPSPMRGASSISRSSDVNGKSPLTTMRAKRSKTETYTRSSSPGWRRISDTGDSRVSTATSWPSPPHRDALHASQFADGRSSPRPRRSRRRDHARATSGRLSSSTSWPTRSTRCSVWLVLGRTWPTMTKRARVVVVGARLRHEQQQVGEAEVGQHPPATDQPFEMLDRRAAQAGVDLGQLGDRGHQTLQPCGSA